MKVYDPMAAVEDHERQLQAQARALATELRDELQVPASPPEEDLRAYAETLRSTFNEKAPDAAKCRYWCNTGGAADTVALLTDLRARVVASKGRGR